MGIGKSLPSGACASLGAVCAVRGRNCIALVADLGARVGRRPDRERILARRARRSAALGPVLLIENKRNRKFSQGRNGRCCSPPASPSPGDLAFWHWSIQYTSVANSTLLANLASIFVTLAAWVLWKQRPSGLFLPGLAPALLGVGLLVRASLGFSPTALLGDGLGVVTAMFYAWYLLSVKGLRDRGAATLQLMAVTTTITAVILLPVALASGEPLLPQSATGWLKLLGLAWISHAAGQGLIAYALAHLPAAFSVGRAAAAAGDRGAVRLAAAGRAAFRPAVRRRRSGAFRHLPGAQREIAG